VGKPGRRCPRMSSHCIWSWAMLSCDTCARCLSHCGIPQCTCRVILSNMDTAPALPEASVFLGLIAHASGAPETEHTRLPKPPVPLRVRSFSGVLTRASLTGPKPSAMPVGLNASHDLLWRRNEPTAVLTGNSIPVSDLAASKAAVFPIIGLVLPGLCRWTITSQIVKTYPQAQLIPALSSLELGVDSGGRQRGGRRERNPTEVPRSGYSGDTSVVVPPEPLLLVLR
jgi:hypothetical protein